MEPIQRSGGGEEIANVDDSEMYVKDGVGGRRGGGGHSEGVIYSCSI